MLNLTYQDCPDIEKYAANIKASGTSILIDYNKYSTLLGQLSARLKSAEFECIALVRLITCRKISDLSSTSLLSVFINYCGLSETEFTVRGKEGSKTLSLDATKVLQPLYERYSNRVEKGNTQEGVELTVRLLESYMSYKTLKTLCSNAAAKLKRFSSQTYEGNFSLLKSISFSYEQKVTGRFYTSNDSIQNWNLSFVPTITTEKGYFLLWCDFAQIDFRIGYHTYLREINSTADSFYLQETDKYLAMYLIMCNQLGLTPDREMFKKYRKGYKKAVLSAMYGASEASLVPEVRSKELAHNLKEFYNTNPRYQEYLADIDRLIAYNYEIPISDYFGFKRTLQLQEHMSERAVTDIISRCCNTPIQATTNSLLILWLEAVLQAFEQRGYSRETDVVPYLIRHDEVIFKVSFSAFKDIWIFEDNMSIALDDWDTLVLEPHLGFYYKEPNQELESLYAERVKENAAKLTPRLVSTPRPNGYSPLPKILDIYTYSMATPVKFAAMLSIENSNAEFSNETAWDFIKSYAEAGDLRAVKYMAYYNKWVIYSSKLKRYKCINDLGYAVAAIRRMQSPFMECHTVLQSGMSNYEEIVIQIETHNSAATEKLLDFMASNNYPEEWTLYEP